MTRFDPGWLKRDGEAPPDTVELARLRAEEAPHPDLKPLARRYMADFRWGLHQDDYIMLGLLAFALVTGVVGVAGLLGLLN